MVRKGFGRSFLLSLLSVLFCFVSCGQSVVSNSQSSSCDASKHKLVVFVSGLNSEVNQSDITDENNGYGLDAPAWGMIESGFITSCQFKYSHYMAFSYSGSGFGGVPRPYDCAATFNNGIKYDVSLLSEQINLFLQAYPNTEVYLIGHSLGGVVAFTYVATVINQTHNTVLSNGGHLRGLSVNDSPLGGVDDHGGYAAAMLYQSFKCSNLGATANLAYQSIADLSSLFNTGSPGSLGETASVLNAIMHYGQLSNQQIAAQAADLGVRIIIVGNTNDLLWRPDMCNGILLHVSIQDFLSTQFLRELGEVQNGGALYARSFTNGSLNCAIAAAFTLNHLDVYGRFDVAKAIWEVFTDQMLDELNPLQVQEERATLLPTVILPGTWTGNASASPNGGDSNAVGLTLVIDGVSSDRMGSSVSGKLIVNNGSATAIRGTITYVDGKQIYFEFTDQGNTYSATYTSDGVRGYWSTPGKPTGHFYLQRQSSGTQPTPGPSQQPTPGLTPEPTFPPTPQPTPQITVYVGQIVDNNAGRYASCTLKITARNGNSVSGYFAVQSPLDGYSGKFDGTMTSNSFVFTVTPDNGSAVLVMNGSPGQQANSWAGQFSVSGTTIGNWQLAPQ